MQIALLHESGSQSTGIQQLNKVMTQVLGFARVDAFLPSRLTNSELQETLENISAKVNGAFKPTIFVQTSRILPSFVRGLAEAIRRNQILASLP